MPGATRYVPVDESLTEPTPTPAMPVPLCMDAEGWPVLCDRQIAELLRATQGALSSCNVDKAAIATLPVEAPGG